MTKVITATLLLVFPLFTHAETFNEARAQGMVAVLESQGFTQLLQENEGLGNLEGIEFFYSFTADLAERFRINFGSSDVAGRCSIVGRVDGINGSVTFNALECESKNVFSRPQTVCNNPTSIGCMD